MKTEEAKQFVEQIQRGKREKDSPDLQAALKLLAEELNTKETHFILELLQNAEDNEYGDQTPELRLNIVTDSSTDMPSAGGCLVVLNNEIGFQPANVLSLSSVGQSTKKKNGSHGYIGEKGIGFKSVFRVTDSPHIFSNGFQFRFQKPTDADPLGYILPHWVESVPAVVPPGFTAILLPLLPGKRQLIEAQLAKIAPETVLFLQKLKRLHLGSNRTIAAKSRPPFVSLASDGYECTYFVQSETYTKPPDIIDERRAGVTTREVTMAFPLRTSTQCTGRLFAFLPTEFDTGLPFLVNADFILNSNRERVLEDRRWNQWLRDQIAPTFVKTFLSVLQHPDWQDEAHRFLPTASDLTPGADFVRPVVEAVQTQLKKECCVLTDTGSLELPAAVCVPSALARRVLSDVPRGRLRFSLLHPAWEISWNDRLKPLEVKRLTFAQLFEACNDHEWLNKRNTDWWETFLELCAKCDVSAQTAGAFPMLRCRDGTCRPLSHTAYSNVEDEPTNIAFPSDWPAANLLEPDLQRRLQQKPEVWNWLAKIAGLTAFSVKAYIVGSLLEWMQRQTQEKLLQATQFIVKNLKQLDQSALKVLREQMPWFLADGQVLLPGGLGGRELVTPECLEDDIGWNLLFSALDRHFCVIHDDYCSRLSAEGIVALRELFKACRATPLPDPRSRKLNPGAPLYDQMLARCAWVVSGTPMLRDWAAPGWLLGLEDVENTVNGNRKIAALERWLKALGPDYSKTFLHCSELNGVGDWQQIRVWSEFGDALRKKRWLRTTKGYVAPPTAFLDTPEFREFFGEAVAYVVTDLPTPFLEKLGVRIHLTAEVLIGRLREMSGSSTADIALLAQIFRRLQDSKFDASCFAQEKLVFLVKPHRWLSTDKLVWEDTGELFDVDFGYVCLTYGKMELQRFFTEILKVPFRPELKHYAAAWKSLSLLAKPERPTVERKLKVILPYLADRQAELATSNWWRELTPQLRVWTDRGEFQTPARTYVPDHSMAAELFAGLIYVAFPPKQNRTVLGFLRWMACPSLANVVQTRLAETTGDSPRAEPVHLTPAAKELCVLLVCSHQGWQDRCPLLQALLQTIEVTVTAITVEYSLFNESSAGTQPQSRDAYWDSAKRRLLLRDGVDQETLRDAAAKSIATEFFGEAGSADTQSEFFRLLTVSVERARKLVEGRSDWQLTPDQQDWLRQQGWKTLITELDEVEQAAPPRTPIEPAAPNLTVPPSPKASGQPGTTDGGQAPSQSTPNAPGQRTPEAPPPQPPKTNKEQNPEPASDTPQELHDADTTSADFVSVREHTRSRPQRSRPQQTQHNRSGAGGLNKPSPEDKAALEQCGREHATKKLVSLGYTVTPMSQHNPGFDLKAEKPGETLKVEVKAHAGEASTVFITQREWQEYLRTRGIAGEAWALWNVENLAKVTGKQPTIDPFRHIPKAAMKESGYWIDLNQCLREEPK